jgi:hypothetical protein
MRSAPIGPYGCGRCSLPHVLRSHRRIVLSLEHVTNVSFAALHTRLFTRLGFGVAWKGNARLLSNPCRSRWSSCGLDAALRGTDVLQ